MPIFNRGSIRLEEGNEKNVIRMRQHHGHSASIDEQARETLGRVDANGRLPMREVRPESADSPAQALMAITLPPDHAYMTHTVA